MDEKALFTEDNLPFTVIGVTPPEFFGADPVIAPDVYVPMRANLLLESRIFSAATYLDPNYENLTSPSNSSDGYSAKRTARMRPENSFECHG